MPFNKITREILVRDIETALLAIGGEEWSEGYCECDPSVGITLCEYCAIHHALTNSKSFVTKVLEI